MSKVIENKSTGIKLTEERNVNYADLLATVVNKPLKEVIDIKSMRLKLALLKKFEDAGETIELNDEQFEEIAKEVETSQWAMVSEDIIAFVDYIDSLK